MSSENQSGSQSKRRFAATGEELPRKIARKGDRAAHERGTAHERSPEEADERGNHGGKGRGYREYEEDDDRYDEPSYGREHSRSDYLDEDEERGEGRGRGVV